MISHRMPAATGRSPPFNPRSPGVFWKSGAMIASSTHAMQKSGVIGYSGTFHLSFFTRSFPRRRLHIICINGMMNHAQRNPSVVTLPKSTKALFGETTSRRTQTYIADTHTIVARIGTFRVGWSLANTFGKYPSRERENSSRDET